MTKYLRIETAEPSDRMKRLLRACDMPESECVKLKAIAFIPAKKKRKKGAA